MLTFTDITPGTCYGCDRLATSSLCGAKIQIGATSSTTSTTSPVGLQKGQALHNNWEKPGNFRGVPFCDKDLEKIYIQSHTAFFHNSHLHISLSFSLKHFVLHIKYKAELYLYTISVHIKVELSLQEVNLSLIFELMSRH